MRSTGLMMIPAVAALMAAVPHLSARAHAAPAAYCGTALVAGIALCIGWDMKVSEYRLLAARARAGDRDAALTLAQFEDERTDIRSDGRKWWARAAQLGECQALRKLRDDALRIGNLSVVSHWRTRVRHFRCTPHVDGERYMGLYR